MSLVELAELRALAKLRGTSIRQALLQAAREALDRERVKDQPSAPPAEPQEAAAERPEAAS